MSQQVLQMKYHPAKKEVSFTRLVSGKEMPITGNSGSVLSKYINKRGQFILQNYGSKFFEDILEAFDGEKEVNLSVITTKKDYEDFSQMIKKFNKNSDVEINPNLITELPDMETAYEVVKKLGLDSVDILKINRDSFQTVDSSNENVRECINAFCKEINLASRSIEEKIDALKDNSVNVCFSGPYSSGKSTLINSLIGYEVLPTAIKPETAAMVTIRSPRDNENVRLQFNISDAEQSFAEIAWDSNKNCFVFVSGPAENDTKKEIQNTMNLCKEKMQHEQVRDILKTLNDNVNVERVINLVFPISIDNDRVQFTIYDTPGTDSGVMSHKKILMDALSEQTHSILIFVTYPQGLCGGGNRSLLEYLSEIEEKKDKSTIDMDRSLFVINCADDLEGDEDAFESIRTGKITNKDDLGEDGDKKQKIISIKLSDKKVFFTSAKYAYPAVAMKNGVANKKNEVLLKSGSARDILSEDLGLFYRQDRCATSEYATDSLISYCEKEMEQAKASEDIASQMWVASGLSALENEIKEYGEKYASAVKTFAIIDGVDKALAKLNRNAVSIEKQNISDIKNVENEINSIRTAITESITNAKKGKEIAKGDAIPEMAMKNLRLDADSIEKYVQKPAVEKVDNVILSFWQKLGRKIASKFDANYQPEKTAWNKENEKFIMQAISDVLKDYTDNFVSERKKLLEELRNSFIDDIRTSISNNGELSDAAKSYIMEIEAPEVEKLDATQKIGALYRESKKYEKKLLGEQEYLDRESFISELYDQLGDITETMSEKFKENYRKSLNDILVKVESEFKLNMDKYSLSLKAKLEDKEAMEELREKILVAVDELKNCQGQLDSIIWEVK